MREVIFALLLLAVAPTSAAADSPLRAFDFFAGHCWQGTFADGISVDTHCYEWVYGDKHLRDVHVVRGEGADYCGESLYSVDGASGDVIFRYWNSLGGVSDGRIVVEGGVLVAPGEKYVGEDGKPREFRSSLRQLDAARYEARTEELIGGQWRDFSSVTFTRVDATTVMKSLRTACAAENG